MMLLGQPQHDGATMHEPSEGPTRWMLVTALASLGLQTWRLAEFVDLD